MSIHNLLEKINPFRVFTIIPEKTRLDIIIVLLIIMSGVLSFGLGRISKVFQPTKQPVTIQQANGLHATSSIQASQSITTKNDSTLDSSQSTTTSTTTSNSVSVVASKQGSKYHYSWCSGAKTIAAKNKITFKSAESALKAGYTLAANCKAQ